MPTNTRHWVMLVMCTLCTAPVFAARKPKPQPAPPAAAAPIAPERVTSVEGITEYRLANGLRVLLFPDQTKQTITVNVTYLVGSRHENYGETGMAHLLEHMVFKGSPRHTNIPNELTSHGARPNGSTSWDRTNYFETFSATDENLRWALDLESDRMVNSFIAKKDLDSEMTVVRNEYEMGENEPSSVLFKRLSAVAFDWHNYGNTPIGARSDIEGVPIERLQAFYRTYYQPDNAIVLVAGKIDEAATLALVGEYFAAIPRPARTLPEQHTIEPTQDGERLVTLRREGDTQMALVAYHIPAGSHEDFAPLQILGEVLGSTPSGRLYKELVEKKKAAAVYSMGLQLQDPGLGGFGAMVRTEQSVDEALRVITSTVENPALKPVTDVEVDRARAQILAQIELTLNNSEYVGLTLSEWEGMGDWRLMFLNRDRLRAVKTADVQRVWANYVKSSNRTAGLFYPTKKPERAEIPARPDVTALLKDYKGDAVRVAGDAFDPSIANIEASTRRVKLADGFQLALLPKKTRGGTVVAAFTLRWGDVRSLQNRSPDAAMAAQMLMRGTARHTRQQLADELDKLKARVNVSSWGSGAYVSIEATHDTLAPAIALVAEMLHEPAFDAKELEAARTEWLAGLEQQRSDPQALAFSQFTHHLQPYKLGDVRYSEDIDESIVEVKAITREGVVRFHHDFFGMQGGQFTAIGDFTTADVEAQVTKLFGGWKSAQPFTRVPSEYLDAAAKQVKIETPDKAQAFYVAGMNLALRDDDPDYPALVLGNYMLGGGFMNSRLSARIRQKDGLSYGVGSQLAGDSFEKSGSFMAYAMYAPENAAKLQLAFTEELNRVLNEDFSSEEIAQAKSGWLQSRTVSRTQDNELVGKLAHYMFLGRPLEWDSDLEAKVSALDGAQIRAALKKHIDPAKFTIVQAGDFAGAAKKKTSTP